MLKKLVIIISIAFLSVSFLLSQQNGEKLMKDLQSKFDKIDNLSVDFTQKHNDKVSLMGILLFKKQNKIRIEAKQLIIVSDGTTSWNYNKKENKVIISNYDENDPGIFSINDLVYRFPEECDITAATENGLRSLTFAPRSYKYNFDSLKIWLNDENLISKVLIIDSEMGQIEVEFSNYKVNQNINDSEFSFIPPEGSKIIDLR